VKGQQVRTVIRNSDWIVAHDGGGDRYATGDVAFTGDVLTHVGGRYGGAAEREIDGRGFMVMLGLVNIHSHPASEPLNKGWNDEIGSPRLYNPSLCEIMPIFQPDAAGVKAAFRVALCEALMSGVTRRVGTARVPTAGDPGRSITFPLGTADRAFGKMDSLSQWRILVLSNILVY
jgi:cytosine/adenosine deaminase-related metal-dependent hydrolase